MEHKGKNIRIYKIQIMKKSVKRCPYDLEWLVFCQPKQTNTSRLHARVQRRVCFYLLYKRMYKHTHSQKMFVHVMCRAGCGPREVGFFCLLQDHQRSG